METSSAEIARRNRAVARWLLLGVAMIFIQTMLGGITRLTGSGLSITEWKPILGAIPPLNERDWETAFRKYQQIAQYKYLNAHFTLHDFKRIYFWEWLHREWARVGLALVFAIGFIYFLCKKYFTREMVPPLIVLFVLGALQGLIGWLMVRTGLNTEDLYVGHFALSIHFIAAMALACYTLWFALKLLVHERDRIADTRVRNLTLGVIALLCVQLIYGAFMAGLKAAPVAPTWPSINGAWIPQNVHQYGGRTYAGLSAWTSQPIAVHFVHRTLAYLLCIIIILWYKAAGKPMSARLRRWRQWPVLIVITQVLLGIATVLHGDRAATAGRFGTFELLAEAHQLVAMCLFVALVCNLYLLRGARR